MNNVIILKYFVKQGRCAYPLLRFHDFIFHLFGIIGAAQVAGITITEAKYKYDLNIYFVSG